MFVSRQHPLATICICHVMRCYSRQSHVGVGCLMCCQMGTSQIAAHRAAWHCIILALPVSTPLQHNSCCSDCICHLQAAICCAGHSLGQTAPHDDGPRHNTPTWHSNPTSGFARGAELSCPVSELRGGSSICGADAQILDV